MEAFNTYMDRLIGADRLTRSMRSQLLFEQVQSISQLTPVMSAGAVAISLLLMAMSLDEDVLPSIVAWSAALYAALFVGCAAGCASSAASRTGSRRRMPSTPRS